MERDGEVLRLWVIVSDQVKHGMVAFQYPLELLEPWEQVPLWAPLSPLELPHRYVGGNAAIWGRRGKWERDRWLWLVGLALDGCALKFFGQLLERLHLLVPNMGIGGSWCRVLEIINNLGGGDCCIF